MKIYASDLLDKQEQQKEAPVIYSESVPLEEVMNVERTDFVDEFEPVEPKFVIKVGEQWFKLLCPFTLVYGKEDAAILTADVARAQSHRILRIKKLQNEIIPL